MNYETETAQRYRQHAASLRHIATGYEEEELVVMLLGVADDYEKMARAFDGADSQNLIVRTG